MQEVFSQWIIEYWPDETLGNVLLSRGFIVLWCSLIVLYFLICTSWLIKNAIPLQLALKKATKRLDGFQGEEEFFKRFETYDTWIKGQKRLNHVWCEFTESLVFPPPGSGATVIQNTAEPAEFLNEATILGRNIARRFFQSVPSHLTAGGILGTFLGLAAGIGVAATGLTSGDQEAVTNALGNLLHGASLAFVTSIFGIFFSLVFLVTYRFLISMVLRAQDRWVFTLEGRLRLITPERVALDQLHESQRQTKQLERFNDELVFSIEKALEEKIAQKLTPQLSALVGAVEQLGAERSTDNTHALEKMVGEFTTALTERTGSEFDKVSATVERLGLTLEASVKAMDRTQQELGEALNRMLATISSSLSSTSTQFQTELAEAIGQVTDTLQEAMSTVSKQLIGASDAAAERISGSLTGFEQGVGKLEQTTAASTNLIQTADEMFQKFGGIADTLERTGTQFKEMLEPLRDVVGTLKSSSDRMSTTLRDTAQLVEGVNRSVQSIETAQQKTSLAWDDYRQRFENIDQSLLKVFGQMDEGLARYTEQVRQFANDLDQHTSKAIQNLAAATGELDDAISHFLEGTVRTTQ